MKVKTIFAILIVVSMLITSIGFAEDGELFRRNISKTPDLETEKAGIKMMPFYVPAQSADGIVGPVDNYCGDDGDIQDGAPDTQQVCESVDDAAYMPRDYAKPLVTVWIDGTTEWQEQLGGGIVLGAFDAFAGVSLDDGTTWKRTNISNSADLSSFTGTKPGVNQGLPYPGTVHQLVHQVFDDNIFVAWASKYCDGGTPLYTLAAEVPVDGVGEDGTYDYGDDYLDDLKNTYGLDDVYLVDYFGVGGSQRSVDYTAQYHPEVGEIPYSCIWTARGKLLAGDDPATTDAVELSYVMWAKPERLTSGRRDANLPAVDCADGAGCILTWQEDPSGLRPGQGLGPGEGWSGAVAWQQTDIWYSHISAAVFDKVFAEEEQYDGGITMAEYAAGDLTTLDTMPKSYVPMAMPVRLTDNHMCKTAKGEVNTESEQLPYCFADFSTSPVTLYDTALDAGENSTFCATQEEWTNPGGTTLNICVAQDGRLLSGRVAATRVRLNLKPYTPSDAVDLDGDGELDKHAWVVMAAEESKALGDTAETTCPPPSSEDYDPNCEADDPIDIGKDVWYYSFDPFKTGVDVTMVQQGGMLNQPAQCKYDYDEDPLCTADELAMGDFYPIQYDGRAVDGDGDGEDEGYEYRLTEIARRFALTTNSIPAAVNSTSRLSAMLIYKQGIINQGGPADIMVRRTIVPADQLTCTGEGEEKECTLDNADFNPYAYENMECQYPDGSSAWVYQDTDGDGVGENPNYLQGLCLSPAINITGSTIADCDGAGDDSEFTDISDGCADAFPVLDDGSNPTPSDFPKVYEWRQLPYEATAVVGDDITLGPADFEDDTDLDDQSWENPYDVAKGHRGFLDGDIVMLMYAWSPNWNSNAEGNDHYNLYARRSFDGGLTWTTTPAEFGGVGVEAVEYYYGDSIGDPVQAVWSYGVGAAEQGRNLSMLTGNQVTVLDPRYSPTGSTKLFPTISSWWLDARDSDSEWSFTSYDELPYDDDAARDPAKFFIVYETGDNTTVAEGEATPLDLFYSRATVYGDVWEWFDYTKDEDDCTPDDVTGEVDWTACIQPRWPWLENSSDDLSGEASMLVNPGGTFMYSVWNQWQEDILPDGHELVHDSDIIYRRLIYLMDDDTRDFPPVADILYVSTDKADYETDIVLVGSARDIDKVNNSDPTDDGIVEAKWKDEYTGLEWNERTWNFKPQGFKPGHHDFSFRAKDNEGNWSQPKTVTIWIAEQFYDTYLPLVTR